MKKEKKITCKDQLKQQFKKFGAFLMVKKGLSVRTRDLYFKIVGHILIAIGTQEPTEDDIYQYLTNIYQRKYSSSHMRNTQVAVEHYMEFIGTPIELKRPKKKRRIIGGVLTEAEVAVLIAAAANIREKAIISLLACTGIRNQELCDLMVRDIDFNQNIVRIQDGKGNSAGYSNVPTECTSILAQYLQEHPRAEDGFLFTTLRKREQYTTWALRRLVKKLADKAQLCKRVFPHQLRHTLATALLRRGANPMAVQWQLRHRHLATTLLYIHSGYGNNQREVSHFQPAYL